MKKTFILLMVFCLLGLTLAPAFATDEDTFSLRNGYTWGMSREEALALAEAEGLVMESLYGTGLHFFAPNVPVGDFVADRFYLHFRELDGTIQLYSMVYHFMRSFKLPHSADLQMASMLNSLYGDTKQTYDQLFAGQNYWDLGHTTITLRKVMRDIFFLKDVAPLCAIYYLQKTPPVQ